jgi:hypothetical protein
MLNNSNTNPSTPDTPEGHVRFAGRARRIRRKGNPDSSEGPDLSRAIKPRAERASTLPKAGVQPEGRND